MDNIIHVTAGLRCDAHRAFQLFTVNELLRLWLAPLAEVEPVAGGKYELFWEPTDRENNSTIGCKVTAIEADKFLSFEWRGPKQFKTFMNNADPLTHVVIFFTPSDEGANTRTDAHLIHSGWRSAPQWEEARQWFENSWSSAFEELRKQVDKSKAQGGTIDLKSEIL
jgi:uncharacterized protein YndB with AHSA1/START domain